MAANTLMTLRRLTRNRLGIPMSDDFLTDPIVDDHINLALQAIDAEYRWPWNEVIEQVTITPDVPDIPLTTDWIATRGLYNGDSELYPIAPGDIITYTGAVGELPRVWCPIAEAIVVRPVVSTDTILTHYWSRQSPWLQQDIDTPTMPAQFTGAIVAKTAELLASREGAGADATRHGAEAESWIAKMRRDVRNTTTPTRVRVRPGSWI